MFDINSFNVISDDNYYYVFRALEYGDSIDISEGIKDVLRTDRERYNGIPKYSENSKISLEEMFDHIKMHYRHDTNCISFSTNAGVAILYGRDTEIFNKDEFIDNYMVFRIPKETLEIDSFFAPKYFLDEIKKIISKYYMSASKEARELLKRIDSCTDSSELKDFISSSTDYINDMFQGGIEFKVTNSLNYSALNNEQNLEKNKLIAKINLLPFNIIPNVDNHILIKTLGSAFASMEVIKYGSIPCSEYKFCPKGIIDIFSILQQSNHPKVKSVEKILIDKLYNGELSDLKEFDYMDYKLTLDDLSIDNIYNVTNGKCDYKTIKDLYMKTIYLAKSKLLAYHYINLLGDILGNDYNDLLDNLKKYYGVETNIINKLSIDKIKLSDSIGLDFNTELEMNILNIVLSEYSSESNLIMMLNNKQLCFKILMEDLFSDYSTIDKNIYYANAIIDSFDWKKFNISYIEDYQRQQLVNKLIENNCVDVYYKLKEKGINEKDISSVLLTTIIRGSKVDIDNIDCNDVFELEELEYFIGYYKLKEANILLSSYHALALSNIEKLYKNNNYASIILPLENDNKPVIITEILSMIKNGNDKILYLVSSDIVIYQIQKYLFEHVIGNINTFGKTLKERELLLKEKFPNLIIAKYSSIIGMDKEQYINNQYDFIVLDEEHRTGADNILKNLKVLFTNQNNNYKVLGITSTAVRDIDSIDMTDYWALYFGYKEPEVAVHKHLGLNLNVYEAISLGYIVNPKKIVCEYELLRENGDFDNISKKIELIEDEDARNKVLIEYERCRKEINEADGVKKILTTNLQKGNRYIVFLPIVNNKGEVIDELDGNSKITGNDIVKSYKELLEEYFGKDNIECFDLQGSSSVSISNINNFENSSSDKISFLLVFDKLNGSTKVKNDGIIWFRPIDRNSSILCTKQLENVLYPLYPGQEIKDEERPLVIDLTNNLYRVKKDGESISKNNDYIGILNTIIQWMHNNGMKNIPNINSKNCIEARYSKILSLIQKKYMKYSTDKRLLEDLDETQKYKINEIIRLGNSIDLWTIVFQEKQINSTNIKQKQQEDLLAVTGILSDFDKLNDIVDESFKQKWVLLDFDEKINKIIEEIKKNNGEFIDKENYMYKWLSSPKNKKTLIMNAKYGDIECIYIGLRMGYKDKPWVPYEVALNFYPIEKNLDGLPLYPFNPMDISYRFNKSKGFDEKFDMLFDCLKNNYENPEINEWLSKKRTRTNIEKRITEGDLKALYIGIRLKYITIREALKINNNTSISVDGVKVFPQESMYTKSIDENINRLFDILKVPGADFKYYSEEFLWFEENKKRLLELGRNGNVKAMFICLRKKLIYIKEILKMDKYSDPHMMVDGIPFYPPDSIETKKTDEIIDYIFKNGVEEVYYQYIFWMYENKEMLLKIAKDGNIKAMFICVWKGYITPEEVYKINIYHNPDLSIDGKRLYPEDAIYIKSDEEIINNIFSQYPDIRKLGSDYLKWLNINKEKLVNMALNGNEKAMYICIKENYIFKPRASSIEKFSDPNMMIEGKRLYSRNLAYIKSIDEAIDIVFNDIKKDELDYEESNWLILNKAKIKRLALNGNLKAMYICIVSKFISISEALSIEYYKDTDLMVDGLRLYPSDSLYIKTNDEIIDFLFEKCVKKTYKHVDHSIWQEYLRWSIDNSDLLMQIAKNGNAKAMYLCLKWNYIQAPEALKISEYSNPDMMVDSVELYSPQKIYFNDLETNINNIYSSIIKSKNSDCCSNIERKWIIDNKEKILDLARSGNEKALTVYSKLFKLGIKGILKIIFDNITYHDYDLICSTKFIHFITANKEKVINCAKEGCLEAMYMCLRKYNEDGSQWITNEEALNIDTFKDKNMMVGNFRLYPKNQYEIFIDNFFEEIKNKLKRFHNAKEIYDKVFELAKEGNIKALYICLRILDNNGNPVLNESDFISKYPIDTMIDDAYLYPSVESNNINKNKSY